MKINFLFTISGLLLLFIVDIFSHNDYCSYSCIANYDGLLANWLFFFVINLFFLSFIFFFNKLLYKRWWSFSKYATPLVIFFITLIGLGLHHSPSGDLQNIIDVPILILVYSFFILGSIIQIIRGYRKG